MSLYKCSGIGWDMNPTEVYISAVAGEVEILAHSHLFRITDIQISPSAINNLSDTEVYEQR
jgi:hypothetical protein